jgi:Secretion system C-terminal sorting domain
MSASLVFGTDTVINPDGNSDILLLKLDHTIVNQVDSNIVNQLSTFYAGQDTGRHVMYYDFVPDTVIVMHEVNGDWHIHDGDLNLDLNHDGINDFDLKEYNTFSPGHSYDNYYINCLNGNQVVTITDTSGEIYAYPLPYGTRIDTCTSWSANDSVVLGGTFSLNIGGQTSYWGPWNLVVDKYLGVRIIDSADTIYGYIHINRMNGFKILDYGIYGRHIGGDDVVETFSDAFFPNPFHSSAILTLSPTFENSNYKIYNAVGAFIREGMIINQKSFVLNRNGLANGFYFLQLTNESGQQLIKKFEVE